MPTVTITSFDGSTRSIDGRVGDSLMETIRDGGIDDLLALCGGSCSCATCHVFIDEAAMFAALPPMSADEDDLLSGSDHRGPRSRLSCQIRLTDALDGLTATIAPTD